MSQPNDNRPQVATIHNKKPRLCAEKSTFKAPERMQGLDPCDDSILVHIMSCLDVPDVLTVARTNRKFHTLSKENSLWKPLCERCWKDKLFHSSRLIQHHSLQNPDTLYYNCYRDACVDARDRQHMHEHELIYEQSSTIWSFRFKESAGLDWTNHDPWWQYQPSRKVVFLQNHTLQFVNEQNNNELVDPPAPMQWRFIQHPMDLPERPFGSYLRISVANRDVPAYAIFRSPTHNWGFVLESCWGVYANFELPRRNTASREPRDLQDGTLRITNEVQWREAFLYNVGTRLLPEGEQATQVFDRHWQGAPRAAANNNDALPQQQDNAPPDQNVPDAALQGVDVPFDQDAPQPPQDGADDAPPGHNLDNGDWPNEPFW